MGTDKWTKGDFNAPSDLFARLEYDFYYIENRSVCMDIKILLCTLATIFRGSDAF